MIQAGVYRDPLAGVSIEISGLEPGAVGFDVVGAGGGLKVQADVFGCS
jgi:hypothetical protein